MRVHWALAAGCVLLVSACAEAPASSDAQSARPPDAAPSARTTPSAQATSTARPQTPAPTEEAWSDTAYAVLGEAPAIEPADFDAAYLLPGAALVHDGVHHLYPLAFSADPGEPTRVIHLTSADGMSWTGGEPIDVLGGVDVGLDEIGPVPSSAFVEGDGTWVMYGGGRLQGTGDSVIWRATAPGSEGPWTAHPEPVLVPSEDGWDNAITDHPAVIPAEAGYLMAYGGASETAPNRNRIGFATSDDGLLWTRVASELEGADDAEALGPNACGIPARTMFEPHLVDTPEGLMLIYGVMITGANDLMVIAGATSTDGTTWSCAFDEPLLSPTDFPGSPGVHSFSVFDSGDEATVLVEVLRDASSELWLAGPEAR